MVGKIVSLGTINFYERTDTYTFILDKLKIPFKDSGFILSSPEIHFWHSEEVKPNYIFSCLVFLSLNNNWKAC